MSINDTITPGTGPNPPWDALRVQVVALVKELAYFRLHAPGWNVAAAAVAPPVLATATNTALVKSTATTELLVNGVKVSLTATDPLLLAATWAANDPNTLAIGSVRRWQICWDATNATTVITARPSDTHTIAGSPLGTAASALAQCRWPNLPPAGTVIVGILSVANITNVFTPGTTLLGAAGVTATYRDGPDDNCGVASLVSP